MRWCFGAAALAALLAGTQAELVAYEPFNYADGGRLQLRGYADELGQPAEQFGWLADSRWAVQPPAKGNLYFS